MIFHIPRLAIAGLAGDSGKTVVSLSLIAAFRQRGLAIAPFKKGPDYIDAAWLGDLADRVCHNLDTFMVEPFGVMRIFLENSLKADISLIEGNRGIFDGKDAEGTHSTASLAKLLKTPVFLVINVTKTTRTIAALVQGCLNFDPDLLIAGVILNKVAGSRHQKIITEAINNYCGLRVLGAIPKLGRDSEVIPGRHLGLVTPSEHRAPDLARSLNAIALKYLDIEEILKTADLYKELEISEDGLNKAGPELINFIQEKDEKKNNIKINIQYDKTGENPEDTTKQYNLKGKIKKTKIAYIKDEIFSFYYPENLKSLEDEGAELIAISSLAKNKLPDDIDALYIGGGFPEVKAEEISKNTVLLYSVQEKAENGLVIYAECGGLIFLSRSISWDEKRYEMAAVFPVDLKMNKKPAGHGYVTALVDRENPFFKIGTIIKGHEFHYSSLVLQKEKLDSCMSVQGGNGLGTLEKSKDFTIDSVPFYRDGLIYKNTLASYIHIHSYGMKNWAKQFVKNAIAYREKSG